LAGAKPLEIYSEQFPPYNYFDQGRSQGFVVEVVNACLKQMSQNTAITNIPWARAYRYAQSDRKVMVLSMSRIPSREQLFKWVGPVADYDVVFFGRSDSDIQLNSLADAREVKHIGVMRDYSTAAILEEKQFNNLVYIKTHQFHLMKLIRGRIDLSLSSNATMRYRMKKHGVKAAELTTVGYLYTGQLYLAFSKSVGDATVAQWQSALLELKRNGEYKKIQNKYQQYFDREFEALPKMIEQPHSTGAS